MAAMKDALFLVLTLAVFTIAWLVVRGVEKL